jgi:hypothetical protein
MKPSASKCTYRALTVPVQKNYKLLERNPLRTYVKILSSEPNLRFSFEPINISDPNPPIFDPSIFDPNPYTAGNAGVVITLGAKLLYDGELYLHALFNAVDLRIIECSL